MHYNSYQGGNEHVHTLCTRMRIEIELYGNSRSECPPYWSGNEGVVEEHLLMGIIDGNYMLLPGQRSAGCRDDRIGTGCRRGCTWTAAPRYCTGGWEPRRTGSTDWPIPLPRRDSCFQTLLRVTSPADPDGDSLADTKTWPSCRNTPGFCQTDRDPFPSIGTSCSTRPGCSCCGS